jgi:hypothetical protein
MTKIRNKNFGQSHYDSNYLNHVTLHLWQDWNTWSNSRNSVSSNCDCLLNIEHCDHTSVQLNQSIQWPWVSFPNLPLFCLILCIRILLPPLLLFSRWTNINCDFPLNKEQHLCSINAWKPKEDLCLVSTFLYQVANTVVETNNSIKNISVAINKLHKILGRFRDSFVGNS